MLIVMGNHLNAHRVNGRVRCPLHPKLPHVRCAGLESAGKTSNYRRAIFRMYSGDKVPITSVEMLGWESQQDRHPIVPMYSVRGDIPLPVAGAGAGRRGLRIDSHENILSFAQSRRQDDQFSTCRRAPNRESSLTSPVQRNNAIIEPTWKKNFLKIRDAIP